MCHGKWCGLGSPGNINGTLRHQSFGTVAGCPHQLKKWFPQQPQHGTNPVLIFGTGVSMVESFGCTRAMDLVLLSFSLSSWDLENYLETIGLSYLSFPCLIPSGIMWMWFFWTCGCSFPGPNIWGVCFNIRQYEPIIYNHLLFTHDFALGISAKFMSYRALKTPTRFDKTKNTKRKQ